MRRLVAWLAIIGAVFLSACSNRSGSDLPIALTSAKPLTDGSAVMLPGGDYRMVTVRRAGDGTSVFCSEPSPDWAVAFGTAVSASASASAAGKASGSLSGNATTTEAVTAMLGRTAGVVALRDGLYSACQAYVNGVIGKGAYALILSQYGNLLVALASGGGGGASDGPKSAAPAATPAGVAVAVSTGSAGVPPKPAGDTGGTAPSGNSQVAVMQQEAIQAMLVSCLAANDPTVSGSRLVVPTEWLAANCDTFMRHFQAGVEELLQPAWSGATTRPAPPTAGKPAVPRKRRVASAVPDRGLTRRDAARDPSASANPLPMERSA